jgi:hypothetical protein
LIGEAIFLLATVLRQPTEAGSPAEVRSRLESAVVASPTDATSHLALGHLYLDSGYRVPALLALCRFLELEPKSARSGGALATLRQIMGSSRALDSAHPTVVVDPQAKTDEGDFASVAVALDLVASAHAQAGERSEAAGLVADLSALFGIMSELAEESSGFAWDYYRPYFRAMSAQELIEPFAYAIQEGRHQDEVSRWRKQNAQRVRRQIDWSRSYRWRGPGATRPGAKALRASP